MARLTKELKALVERQLVTKIQEAVEKANTARQAAELDNENEMLARRNEVRDELTEMGLVSVLKQANRLLKDNAGVFEDTTKNRFYGGNYDPVIVLNNFDMEKEKPAKKNGKVYYSVDCTNSVGNISIHNTTLGLSGGASFDDEDTKTLQDLVNDIVNTYDKALVSVSLGGDLDDVRRLLSAYGVSF